MNAKSTRPAVAPLQPVPLPNAPWETLGMNIIGPLFQVSSDCRFDITVIDYYSKWPEVCFVREVTSDAVVTFFHFQPSRVPCLYTH